ncbi:MAG: alpha/beta fold hydrolase [Caulobacterales bacterium]
MGEPAPLIDTPLAPVPAGGAGEWFPGVGGARLRAALFPAGGAPRGSVVLSGGRTEPIEKYFEVVGELRSRGFTVLAHDWRGQGLSRRLLPDPMRGHAGGYADFLGDYDALLATFEARLPKPWIALGHSMGGCLTALVLAHGERRFAAAALSAPMLGLLTPPFPLPLAKALTWLATALGASGGYTPGRQVSPVAVTFADNILTHDQARYERNQAQIVQCPDLMLGGPTWGWLAFAFAAIDELQRGAGAARIEIPVLVVAAGADRLVDIEGERLVASRMPKGRLVEAPGAFHEILQETDDVRALFWREFDALADAAAPISPPA